MRSGGPTGSSPVIYRCTLFMGGIVLDGAGTRVGVFFVV